MEIAVNMAPVGPPDTGQAVSAPEDTNQEPFGELLQIVLAALLPADVQAPPVSQGEVATLSGVVSQTQVMAEGQAEGTESGVATPAGSPAEVVLVSSEAGVPTPELLRQDGSVAELQQVGSGEAQDTGPFLTPEPAIGAHNPESASGVPGESAAATSESGDAREAATLNAELTRSAPTEQAASTEVPRGRDGELHVQIEFARGEAFPEADQRGAPAEASAGRGLRVPGVDSRVEEFLVKLELPRQVPGESSRGAGPEVFRMPEVRVAEAAWVAEARSVELRGAEAARLQGNPDPAPSLVWQAMTAVRLALHNPRHAARMLLRPPHLGQLRVEITTEEGRVNAVFRVGTESARQGLLQGMEHLKASMEEQGVRVGTIVVSLNAGAGGFGHGFGAGGEPGGEMMLPPSKPEEPEAVLEEAALVAAPSGLLDVIV